MSRERMLERDLRGRGISNARVLAAMAEVPREGFIAPHLEPRAYADEPLPIAAGQSVSQPYVVALMIEALELEATDTVLEIGAGSGYAAAVLSKLAAHVYTVERHAELADAARATLARLGYQNIDVRCGDGTLGWPEHAPYRAIIVAASGPRVPPALLEQLAVGGRLVMPVADRREQRLIRIVRIGDKKIVREDLGAVRFVPLIGAQGWRGEAP